MEVDHPQHPNNKKKWAEYLLEFLILFPAVFPGFLAENARENMVERKRETYLIGLLKKDLTSDIAVLYSMIMKKNIPE